MAFYSQQSHKLCSWQEGMSDWQPKSMMVGEDGAPCLHKWRPYHPPDKELAPHHFDGALQSPECNTQRASTVYIVQSSL